MGYYEFTVKAAYESRDAVIQRMSSSGCLGVIENSGDLIAYFRDIHDINGIIADLHAFRPVLQEAGLDSELSFAYVYISERDWNETWKKKLTPIDVGDVFSIIPPWEEKKTGRINLIIDPGMAFGTGHHETTRTCLMLMEKLSRGRRKERFLDIGTGTGILAIAASMLGYTHVLGVDIDPLAVDAAQRNIRLNGLDNIAVREGGIGAAGGSYDFIAANLMSEILLQIAPGLPSRLNESGTALLSGMIVSQEDEVIAAMEGNGLRYLDKFVDGRWVSVALTR